MGKYYKEGESPGGQYRPRARQAGKKGKTGTLPEGEGKGRKESRGTGFGTGKGRKAKTAAEPAFY
jgi:hypothetical protein